MWKDPIVEEVRKVRSQIEAECNNDMEKIYKSALEIQNVTNWDLISTPFETKDYLREKESV